MLIWVQQQHRQINCAPFALSIWRSGQQRAPSKSFCCWVVSFSVVFILSPLHWSFFSIKTGTGRSGVKHARDLNMTWKRAGWFTSLWKSAEVSYSQTVNTELKQFLPFFHSGQNTTCVTWFVWLLHLDQSIHSFNPYKLKWSDTDDLYYLHSVIHW